MFSIKTHNILDYVGATVLLLSPWLFGFSEVIAARNLFLFAGLFLAGYSLLTQYTYSAMKLIPLKAHMVLDVMSGILVAIGPWLLGYRDLITGGQTTAHIVLGLAVLGLVAFTRRTGISKTAQEPYLFDRAA